MDGKDKKNILGFKMFSPSDNVMTPHKMKSRNTKLLKALMIKKFEITKDDEENKENNIKDDV